MHFSKIELRQDRSATVRLARLVCRNGYRLHQSLWELFKDEGQRRSFLYRRMEGREWPGFYVVSNRQPLDTADLWNIQVKDYAPKLTAGMRLAFSLCANPVITRRTADGNKAARHDVVMDAKNRLKKDGAADEHRFSPTELTQFVGFSWLAARAEKHGFTVQEELVRVEGYQQHRLYKPRGSQPICFSTIEFNGLLTVTDPEGFQQALYYGIGPAKAFGCGLLLVRRM